MALGPDLWALRRFQSALSGAGLELVSSYVSLTEVSEYAKGVPEEMKQARLFPHLPPRQEGFCFYPMSKRRGDKHNCSRCPMKTARRSCTATVPRDGNSPAASSRSSPLDRPRRLEWGVTLFAVHPDDLKDCVYSMRFDEASSNYASSGPSSPAWSGPG